MEKQEETIVNLQESGEMYLETIYVLTKENKHVRAIDVSEYMKYSKPSVSRAVGILKKGGYLENDTEDGALVLTEEGKRVAEKTYERHRVLTEFFEKIGVSRETAAEDACRIEHTISDETFAALKRYAGIE